jgi:hypothetical protein
MWCSRNSFLAWKHMELQWSNLGVIPGLRLQDVIHKLICHKHNANTGNDFVVFWYYSPCRAQEDLPVLWSVWKSLPSLSCISELVLLPRITAFASSPKSVGNVAVSPKTSPLFEPNVCVYSLFITLTVSPSLTTSLTLHLDSIWHTHTCISGTSMTCPLCIQAFGVGQRD